ncbi:uncharacterized protein BJ171DRAFT_489418 [Polychytrium aggregatum]|uniref:uncharacterized protein n=1 Tax=Polychytrium aggregatum TaxID=110093 RepID=UPI0022FE69D1|nr:uncharacterized protein BJ171DRAFT_489418 [Polychytrium aggregatum]KAI9208587.1 hypothetical protein BJ171DRAFT_489418 [Polychytrium aggregatum]
MNDAAASASSEGTTRSAGSDLAATSLASNIAPAPASIASIQGTTTGSSTGTRSTSTASTDAGPHGASSSSAPLAVPTASDSVSVSISVANSSATTPAVLQTTVTSLQTSPIETLANISVSTDTAASTAASSLAVPIPTPTALNSGLLSTTAIIGIVAGSVAFVVIAGLFFIAWTSYNTKRRFAHPKASGFRRFSAQAASNKLPTNAPAPSPTRFLSTEVRGHENPSPYHPSNSRASPAQSRSPYQQPPPAVSIALKPLPDRLAHPGPLLTPVSPHAPARELPSPSHALPFHLSAASQPHRSPMRKLSIHSLYTLGKPSLPRRNDTGSTVPSIGRLHPARLDTDSAQKALADSTLIRELPVRNPSLFSAMEQLGSEYRERRSILDLVDRFSFQGEPPQDNSFLAVTEHHPEQPDEIFVQIGDTIVVERVFEDGWAVAANWTRSTKGVFPLNCLDPKAKDRLLQMAT